MPVGGMGGVVSLHQVRVAVSWGFALLLMEKGSSLELGWGLVMEIGGVPK